VALGLSGWLWQEPVDVLCVWWLSRKQHQICCRPISQGSAVTSFRWGERVYNFCCEIFSGFCTPKSIEIGSFSPSYSKYKRGRFWDTMYIVSPSKIGLQCTTTVDKMHHTVLNNSSIALSNKSGASVSAPSVLMLWFERVGRMRCGSVCWSSAQQWQSRW